MEKRIAKLAILGLLLGDVSSEAGIIVYTDSITASGFLGNDFFSNSPVTLTSFAETTDVLMGNGFYHSIGPMTVTVTSLDITATVITDFVGVYFYTAPFTILDGGYALSFADDSQSGIILETESYDFEGYDLKTPLGPITGNSFIEPALRLPTDHGGLVFTAGGNSTFTATLVLVQEPASVVLAGLASGILFLLYCRFGRGAEADRPSVPPEPSDEFTD